MRNKEGSATVLTIFALTSLMIMLIAFTHMSKKIAIDSAVDSLEQVYATSILAEYDKELYNTYKIFGFYGNEKIVDDKIYGYAEDSMLKKKYVKWQGASSVVYDYSLGNSNIFRKQVIAEGKILVAKDIFDKARGFKSKNLGGTENHVASRKIKNEEILGDLPSAKYDESLSILDIIDKLKNLNSVKDVFNEASDDYIISRYIDVFYNNYCSNGNAGRTYFSNEIEYLIGARPSDESNRKYVKTLIVSVREAMNLAYLNKSPEKTKLVDAVAELITPGPEAAITREGLLSAWALAESLNDYEILIHGKKLPFIKDESSWATDLDSVVNNEGQGYIEMNNEKGDSYINYLNGFLWFIGEDTKLSRMMDLIQINMKFNYWDDFRLDDFYGGVKVRIKVNDSMHEFEKVY